MYICLVWRIAPLTPQLVGEVEGLLLGGGLEKRAPVADDHEPAVAQIGRMQFLPPYPHTHSYDKSRNSTPLLSLVPPLRPTQGSPRSLNPNQL